MNETEAILEGRLSSLTEQLLAEQEKCKQLLFDIDLACTREKVAIEALSELKEKFENVLAERDQLKAENEVLKFHLSNGRNKMHRYRTAEDEEV